MSRYELRKTSGWLAKIKYRLQRYSFNVDQCDSLYMEFHDTIYEVEISGKIYGFFIEWKKDGVIQLVIPDAGGQADMSPKYSTQLDWLLPKLKGIKGLKRIWPTIWEIGMESTLRKVERIFEKEGRLSTRTRASFY